MAFCPEGQSVRSPAWGLMLSLWLLWFIAASRRDEHSCPRLMAILGNHLLQQKGHDSQLEILGLIPLWLFPA